MILVSACLLGRNCKYNGSNNDNAAVRQALSGKDVVLVCPEVFGGLSVPRQPCEIVGGDGQSVLQGAARVVDSNGDDVTPAFIKGAEICLHIAQLNKCKKAILKMRSPSCGTVQIYDGSFSGHLIPGDGVTAALLKNHGIEVLSEDEFVSEHGGSK
ncbi:MAG: DUF523 domain-containing protein [Acidobacteriota bacterium]